MAVGLLYNRSDIAKLVAALEAALPALSGADRTAANRVLTALANPDALPIAPVQFQQGDPDTRVIVLPSQSGDRTAVRGLFQRMFAARSDLHFLQAIWKDIRTSAVDPWVG